jgi:hypothetical protein
MAVSPVATDLGVAERLKALGRRDPDDRLHLRARFRPKSEKEAKLAQKLGQLQPFNSCIPTGIHGPTSIFWANLTTFTLRMGTQGIFSIVNSCR